MTCPTGTYSFALDSSGNVAGYTFTDDSDGDGITDEDELTLYHTNPLIADTDGDGLDDGEEINTYHTNPLVEDSDGDGVDDGTEVRWHYDPLDPDNTPQLPLSRTPTAILIIATITIMGILAVKRLSRTAT